MPELPEMQALAERLSEFLAGATLERIDAMQFSALKTFDPPAPELGGRRLASVGRRGKFLVWDLGDLWVAMHLSQGGRIDVEHPPKRTRPKGAVARMFFEGRPSVLVKEFGTERKAAWWVLRSSDPGPLDVLGPEPFSDDFARLVRSGKDGRRLHTMLRDQRTVAGIGRGYVDDILHDARLSPYDTLSKLDRDQREALLSSTHRVLEAALAHERTREGGLPAKLDHRFVVHRKHGRPCPRCGETLHRISYESHEVTYCSACQTSGKVLADRRLSRLLK
jgi:formamidopyrimidine-DNA glycosylase